MDGFRRAGFTLLLLMAPSVRLDHDHGASLREEQGHAEPESKRREKSASRRGGGRLHLLVSCIWEGRDLGAANLRAIQNLRKTLDNLPLIHFVNPAYLARSDAERSRATEVLRAWVKQSDDTIGLYLAPWKSLLERAKVSPRTQPTFWGYTLTGKDCVGDCGSDVPLNVFDVQEIRKILRTSVDLIKTHDLGDPKAMMAAGWLATPKVLSAAVEEGLTMDFSAVAPDLLRPTLERYPLGRWIRDLWPDRTPFAQPLMVPTDSGAILEIGNGGMTLDHGSRSTYRGLMDAYLGMLDAMPDRPLYFHIGFYQETAARTLPLLQEIVQELLAGLARRGHSVSFDFPKF